MSVVRNARIKIEVPGHGLVPYSDAHWMFLEADGFPFGFLLVDRSHLREQEESGRWFANPARAAREFYGSVDEALRRLGGGDRIEMIHHKDLDHWLKIHTGQLAPGQTALPITQPAQGEST